jgi:hypothetical protein
VKSFKAFRRSRRARLRTKSPLEGKEWGRTSLDRNRNTIQVTIADERWAILPISTAIKQNAVIMNCSSTASMAKQNDTVQDGYSNQNSIWVSTFSAECTKKQNRCIHYSSPLALFMFVRFIIVVMMLVHNLESLQPWFFALFHGLRDSTRGNSTRSRLPCQKWPWLS